jgi:hypothetical protein
MPPPGYPAAGYAGGPDLRHGFPWWARPAFDDDDDYDAPADASYHILWPLSPPHEEEAKEEEEIPVEEYMPSRLSEEEAIQLIIQDSELVELSQWEGLGLQLHASANDDVVVPPPPPPVPPALAPPVGWGHAVCGSPPHSPLVPLGGWDYEPSQQQAPAAAPRVPMVPWSFPRDLPPVIT